MKTDHGIGGLEQSDLLTQRHARPDKHIHRHPRLFVLIAVCRLPFSIVWCSLAMMVVMVVVVVVVVVSVPFFQRLFQGPAHRC